MKQPKDVHVISMIDTIDEDALIVPIKERLGVEAVAVIIINFEGDDIDGYDEIVSALVSLVLTLLHQRS